jgi:NAD(P)-dependent dehydrogenase (short-subunit alcohol dehydrogenase family)
MDTAERVVAGGAQVDADIGGLEDADGRRFHGSAAMVTGGGSGLGLGCARRLAAEGAAVTIVGRSEQRLQAATSTLAAEGLDVLGVPCDVTDEEAVRHAA